MTGRSLPLAIARNYLLGLAFLLMLGAAAPAHALPPVWEGWIVPTGAISGCQDIWVVDARSAPVEGDLAAGMSELQFYRSEYGLVQYWAEHTQQEFLQLADPSLPTTYFFHGYGMGRSGAVISAERLGESVGADAPPFRLVIWAWPARHRVLTSIERNIEEKQIAANAQGYYLAALVRQMHPQSAITLAGHSFGARCILTALQSLALGHHNGVPLPPDFTEDRALQATLMAPAVPSTALSESGEFFLAIEQVDRLLITVNSQDGILRFMSRLNDDESLLGLHGPYDLAPNANVFLLDATPYVGSGHRVAHFAWSGPVATSMQSFLINYGSH